MKQTPTYEDLKKRIQDLEAIVENTMNGESFTPTGFHKLFIEAIVPIFLIDPADNTIIEANPSVVELTGYEREELLGKSISELIRENKAETNSLMAAVQKKSDYRQLNKIIVCKDRSERIIDANFSCYHHQGKELVQIIGVDITERRQAEVALKKVNDMKNKFFSILGHDLKSPFNSMLGFADVLMENFEELNVSEQKRYLSFIHEGLYNTYKTLENLLYWGRSQMDSTEFKPEKLNLYAISCDAIKVQKFPLANKSIELINQIPDVLSVRGDRQMLLIMLRNLVSNAVKFTEANGRIELSAHTITADNSWKFVEVKVSDTGIGIQPEVADRIFRIESITTTKGTQNETGTGLGLTICKQFAEKQGGRIWIESEPGEGTSVLFTIPYHS